VRHRAGGIRGDDLVELPNRGSELEGVQESDSPIDLRRERRRAGGREAHDAELLGRVAGLMVLGGDRSGEQGGERDRAPCDDGGV
jgi:hypothetical protein